MNKLYDVLEICLQELEHGVSLEKVLARYPDLAGELRPILKASIQARTMAVPAPSPDAIRRGRTKLLQHASEMREAKAAPRKRMIPIFQRLALSLGVAAIFLLSGTGLVGVSASALPGEKLYPVKRTWEDLKLFFTIDQNTRAFVKSEYEIERLHEVSELIAEGRYASIQFVGLFTRLNDMTYISGVPVLLPANMQEPDDGVAVLATGRTNAQGFVELESLELLPDGVFVPLGLPMELELKQETNSNSGSNTNSDSNPDSNSNETPAGGTDSGTGDVPSENSNELGTKYREEFEVMGIVEAISETTLVINGKTVYLDNPLIEGDLQNGVKVEIKGYYAEDGRFIVTEVKVKDSVRDGSNKNSDSDSSSNDGDSSDLSDDDSDGNDDSSASDDGGDDSSDDND